MKLSRGIFPVLLLAGCQGPASNPGVEYKTGIVCRNAVSDLSFVVREDTGGLLGQFFRHGQPAKLHSDIPTPGNDLNTVFEGLRIVPALDANTLAGPRDDLVHGYAPEILSNFYQQGRSWCNGARLPSGIVDEDSQSDTMAPAVMAPEKTL